MACLRELSVSPPCILTYRTSPGDMVNTRFYLLNSIAARRLNATDVNLRVRSVACQGHNAHGSKLKIEQL